MTNSVGSRTFLFFEEASFTATWFYLRQRPQQLGRALTRVGHEVVFIEPPTHGGTPELELLRVDGRLSRFRAWVSNEAIIRSNLGTLIERYPDAIWIVHHPEWARRIPDTLLRRTYLVYDCMDEWIAFTGANRDVAHLEARLATESAFVMASSMPLMNRMRLYNSRVIYVPNAVHLEDYDGTPAEPKDLQSIPHPRLLFVGAVADWVDLDLLERVATARPQWSIVLVGPSWVTHSRLPSQANIHYLGKRAYYELGGYMRHADVGIIPFRRNRLTRGVNPLKLHEYLATGLPVVSTFMPDVLLYAGESVRVAYDEEEFVAAIGDVLGRRVLGKQHGPACTHTWHDNARLIEAMLSDDEYNCSAYSWTKAVDGRYVDCLRRAQAREPEVEDIRGELALASYVEGRYVDTLHWAGPESTLTGCALARSGLWDQARRWALAFDANAGGDDRYLIETMDDQQLLAYCLQLNQEFRESLEVLSARPTGTVTEYLLVARAAAHLSDDSLAIHLYLTVIDEDSQRLRGRDWLALGRALVRADQDNLAEDAFLRASLHQPWFVEASEQLSGLYLRRADRASSGRGA